MLRSRDAPRRPHPRAASLGFASDLRALEALAESKRELVPNARVAVKVNARGEVVFAVVVPARAG